MWSVSLTPVSDVPLDSLTAWSSRWLYFSSLTAA